MIRDDIETTPESGLHIGPRRNRHYLPVVSLNAKRDSLEWRLPDEHELVEIPNGPSVAGDVLNLLVKLGDAKRKDAPEFVLNIARRFGVAHLCQRHPWLPASHFYAVEDGSMFRTTADQPGCEAASLFRESGTESIRVWRDWAGDLREIRQAALRLTTARSRVDLRDLDFTKDVERFYGGIFVGTGPFGGWAGEQPNPNTGHKAYQRPWTLEDAREFVSDRLNKLITEAGVRPSVEWDEAAGRFRFAMEPGTLGVFGTAIVALAREVGGLTKPMECSGCGRIYNRVDRKWPKNGQLNFCEVCEVDEAMKRRVQRDRANQRRNGGAR